MLVKWIREGMRAALTLCPLDRLGHLDTGFQAGLNVLTLKAAVKLFVARFLFLVTGSIKSYAKLRNL